MTLGGIKLTTEVLSVTGLSYICYMIIGFLSLSLLIHYISPFAYAELPHNFWNEASLIPVKEHFDVFLNVAHQYFIEKFFIWGRLVCNFISGSCYVFIWFWYKDNAGFTKKDLKVWGLISSWGLKCTQSLLCVGETFSLVASLLWKCSCSYEQPFTHAPVDNRTQWLIKKLESRGQIHWEEEGNLK